MAVLLALALVLGRAGVVILFALAAPAALREFATYTAKAREDHPALALAFFAALPLQFLFVWLGLPGVLTIFIPVYVFAGLSVLAALRGSLPHPCPIRAWNITQADVGTVMPRGESMRSIAAGRWPARFLRRAAAMLLCLAPAIAAVGPDLHWGIPLDPAQGPSELRLDRCENGCFARVSFVNRHLHGPALARRFTLDLEGLEVLVTVEDGALRSPERFTMLPPPGFTAEPATLAVDEDAVGVIMLHPVSMS